MKNPAAHCLYFLHLIVLLISGKDVVGSVTDTLTLPCNYLVHKALHSMCWGRGGCPFFGCNDKIITTDGQKVTWRKSDRYQLLGNITQGNVSLTITGATKADGGTYCCRVETPGAFNDKKKEVNVEIREEKFGFSTNTHFTATRESTYGNDGVSYNPETSTTQRTSFTSQETTTSKQLTSTGGTTYAIAGVVGALFLVALMGVIIYIRKHRSRKTTKIESSMSVINVEALAKPGNATENIYT